LHGRAGLGPASRLSPHNPLEREGGSADSKPMCAEKKPTSASGKETFEVELKKLEKLVESLESGDISLDELVTKYEEGMRLLKSCQKSLEAAELRIEQLGKRGEESEG
jgi:exodeoxyribonuclease VII small subunit